MEEYETVLLVKQEVFVFKIPPRTSNRGYRAADWKLDTPDWTGRMRIVVKGKKCIIKLEDKTTGELFSQSPIENHPGIALEAVSDSSRYFVLRIEDDNGRSAFIGIGFADRSDSFDLNVSLQDHFKWVEKSEQIEQHAASGHHEPNLDLGFKDGQTIKINMNIGKKAGSSKPRPKPTSAGAVPGLLPPPPGGVKASSASKVLPTVSPVTSPSVEKISTSGNDLLLDLGSTFNAASAVNSSATTDNASGNELWGDFATATEQPTVQQNNGSTTTNWMDF